MVSCELGNQKPPLVGGLAEEAEQFAEAQGSRISSCKLLLGNVGRLLLQRLDSFRGAD